MKGKFLLVLAVSFILAQVAAFAEEGWLTKLDEGLKLGKSQNKRVLVDFTATWCGWCTKLKEEVFSKPDFSTYADKNLVLVSIDADENKELVEKYKVDDFPTVFIMDGNGKIVEQVVGFKNLPDFLEVLKNSEGKVSGSAPAPAIASETKPAK